MDDKTSRRFRRGGKKYGPGRERKAKPGLGQAGYIDSYIGSTGLNMMAPQETIGDRHIIVCSEVSAKQVPGDSNFGPPGSWQDEKAQVQYPILQQPVQLSADVFQGAWVDSLGNNVFVCFVDPNAAVLQAILSKPPRSDITLSIRPVNMGGGWQCGNSVLDPYSAWPNELRWIASDGRSSVWVRSPEDSPVRSSSTKTSETDVPETEFVCHTPESWD
eukprot:TRINITY_DN23803_c0_g1_i1.p1 TRINITY_DN23803_c0_g1~~TRINITY_DN23803_c0_g1_i1.p1  ORF type:complete len:217 (+),score=28.86 TRINITY_DN23803_c0_g1_i1:58-708(+)